MGVILQNECAGGSICIPLARRGNGYKISVGSLLDPRSRCLLGWKETPLGDIYTPPPPRGEVKIRNVLMALVSAMTLPGGKSRL